MTKKSSFAPVTLAFMQSDLVCLGCETSFQDDGRKAARNIPWRQHSPSGYRLYFWTFMTANILTYVLRELSRDWWHRSQTLARATRRGRLVFSVSTIRSISVAREHTFFHRDRGYDPGMIASILTAPSLTFKLMRRHNILWPLEASLFVCVQYANTLMTTIEITFMTKCSGVLILNSN